MTVVFDAANAPRGAAEVQDFRGIQVRFAVSHDEADDLSRHGESPLGTTDYIAPEQARDSHAADARADV